MKLTNGRGTPVDPVPLLVVCALAFCLAAGASYHRLVWTARPELRGEIPADQRLRRLLYAILVGIALFALLPLLVP